MKAGEVRAHRHVQGELPVGLVMEELLGLALAK
jgi:hypothetical protein